MVKEFGLRERERSWINYFGEELLLDECSDQFLLSLQSFDVGDLIFRQLRVVVARPPFSKLVIVNK